MATYLLRRLLLIAPVLFVIMLINFAVMQTAPGGPVEQIIANLIHPEASATGRISGGNAGELSGKKIGGSGGESVYRGAQGIDPVLIAALEKQFGFDKPLYERFIMMMKNYLLFDFGKSFFSDQPVVELLWSKLPVSASLGVWSTLIIYCIAIPLGIKKATRDGSVFDMATSSVVIIGYAIPGFLFAIMLIVLFAGGSFWNFFPLSGLLSDEWRSVGFAECATTAACLVDYAWHLVLPIGALSIGGFATLTMLTKNAFLDELYKQYPVTARAKGLSEERGLYGHVFRNAMILVIAGFPGAFIGMFLTGALFIEMIFSLDGLGLLGYEAVVKRDYPVMLGTLYLFSLVGLFLNILTDLTYVLVDPRIDFGKRGG